MFNQSIESIFQRRHRHPPHSTILRYLKIGLTVPEPEIKKQKPQDSAGSTVYTNTLKSAYQIAKQYKAIKKSCEDIKLKKQLKPIKLQCDGLTKQFSSYLLKKKQQPFNAVLKSKSLFKDHINSPFETILNLSFAGPTRTKKNPSYRIKDMQQPSQNLTTTVRHINITKLPVLDCKCDLKTNDTSKQSEAELERIIINSTKVNKDILKGYLIYDRQVYNYYNQYASKIDVQQSQTIPIKDISAQSYCVFNTSTLSFILTSDAQQQIQIASITKVLTAYLTILISIKYQVNLKTHTTRVSQESAYQSGTTAELQPGDIITLQNLLYGTMLPSGNDAATALAEAMGRIIMKNRKKPTRLTPTKLFVSHMNSLYKEMISNAQQYDKHTFNNPTGLPENPNFTTAKQITQFSSMAYKNELFRQIVNTKQHELIINNERYGLERTLVWKNTNKLLEKGWQGIKTGITETAGACFVGKFRQFVVGVFNSKNTNRRFTESINIIESIADK